jgi:hypothetical protein
MNLFKKDQPTQQQTAKNTLVKEALIGVMSSKLILYS